MQREREGEREKKAKRKKTREREREKDKNIDRACERINPRGKERNYDIQMKRKSKLYTDKDKGIKKNFKNS